MPALLQRRNAVLPFRAAAAATVLPQQASILARWSANDLPVQADNSALTSWTDSIGGLAVAQTTGTAQPKYRTGGAGGKPYVLFAGAQYMNAGNSTNAVAQLLQNATAAHTSLVVYRNAQSTSFGFLFSGSVSTGYNLYASGTAAGMYGAGALQRVPCTATGLTTLCYTKRLPDTSTARLYINGGCINNGGPVTAASGQDVWIGGTTTAGTPVKAEIYDVIVWNRALTAAEVMQAEKWARDRYASPYPWAGVPYRVFHGDSLTNGYASGGALTSYPARVAAANGWAFGQWTNLGHVGVNMTTMKQEALDEIDPMLPLLGSTPLWLAAWEWYNQRNVATATTTAAIASYFQARRAAGAAKLVMLSSTDAADGQDNVAARATYNAWLDANAASYCDVYLPVHKSSANGGASEIGPEGACPNASPYTPYFHTDGIHLIDAGYQVLANLVAPALA